MLTYMHITSSTVGMDYANVKPAITAPFKNAKKSILAKHAAMKKEAALREKQSTVSSAIATPPTSKNPSPRNLPLSPSSCPPTPMRTPVTAASTEGCKASVPKMRGTDELRKNITMTRSKNVSVSISVMSRRKAAMKAEAMLQQQPELASNNHTCSFTTSANPRTNQAPSEQSEDLVWLGICSADEQEHVRARNVPGKTLKN